MRVNARPVLYACVGCGEDAQLARKVACRLDAQGLAETTLVNDEFGAAKAKERFPVYAIDGCGKACVRRWLAAHRVRPQRYYVLSHAEGIGAEEYAERIAASW